MLTIMVGRSRGPTMRTRFCAVLAGGVLVAAVCSPATTAHAATPPTVGLVALPVVPCSTTFGASEPEPWQPTHLPVALSEQEATRLAFFSNGFMTVLGPRGWACRAIVAGDGGRAIEVSAPGSAPTGSLPAPDAPAESVDAVDDYTGHGPGALLVCPYFPDSPAAGFFSGGPPSCSAVPKGTTMTHLSADTVVFRFPDTRTGIVIYPQITPAPAAGSNVTLATCRLRGSRASLCTAILRDYAARAYPSPLGAPG